MALRAFCIFMGCAVAACAPKDGVADAGPVNTTMHVQYTCADTQHLTFTSPAGRADQNDHVTAMIDLTYLGDTGTFIRESDSAAQCILTVTRDSSGGFTTSHGPCTDSLGITATYGVTTLQGVPNSLFGSLAFTFTGSLKNGATTQAVAGTGLLSINCTKGLQASAPRTQDAKVKYTGPAPVAGFGTDEAGTDATKLALFPDDLRISRPDDHLFVVSRGAVFKIDSTTFAAERVIAPMNARTGSSLPAANITTLDLGPNGDLLLGMTDTAQNYIGWWHANGTWELLKTVPTFTGHSLFRVRRAPNGAILWTDGRTLSTLDQSVVVTGVPGFDVVICPLYDTLHNNAPLANFCIASLEIGPDNAVHGYQVNGVGITGDYVGGFMPDGRLITAKENGNSGAGAIFVVNSPTTEDIFTYYGCALTDGASGSCANLHPRVNPLPWRPFFPGDHADLNAPMGIVKTDQRANGAPFVVTSTGALFTYTVDQPNFDDNEGGSGLNDAVPSRTFGLYEFKP